MLGCRKLFLLLEKLSPSFATISCNASVNAMKALCIPSQQRNLLDIARKPQCSAGIHKAFTAFTEALYSKVKGIY